MAAKLLAATSIGMYESIEKAGQYAIQSAFRWLEINTIPQLLPSEPWRQALGRIAAARLASSEPLTPEELAFCAWLVKTDLVKQLLSATRSDVQQLAQQSLDQLPEPLRIPTAFLLVTLGLRARDISGLKPLVRGYFDVYEALETSTDSFINFPWDSWLLLSPELPQPSFWQYWDRCKGLRKAVRQWLSSNAKSIEPLLKAAPSKKQKEIAEQIFSEEY
jgi:hypothetical protein